MQEISKYAGPDVNILLLANKSDLDPEEFEVSEEDIKKFEEENNLKVKKVSAKEGAIHHGRLTHSPALV